MKTKIVSLLLVLTLILAMIPFAASAATPGTVYISISDDAQFITAPDGTPIAFYPVTLEVLVQAPDQETPAVAAARQRVARQREAEASIHADPLVQALINDFAAQICAESIRPIDA